MCLTPLIFIACWKVREGQDADRGDHPHQEQEFFQKNLDAKYMALNTYFQEILLYLNEIYLKIPVSALDATLRKLLATSDNTAVMAFTFSAMNLYRLELLNVKNTLVEQKKLERQDKAYISELENYILQTQQHIVQ